MRNDYDECELILFEMMSIWKNVLYYFKFLGLLWELLTLCLPIPLVSVMYPWVLVVTYVMLNFSLLGINNPNMI